MRDRPHALPLGFPILVIECTTHCETRICHKPCRVCVSILRYISCPTQRLVQKVTRACFVITSWELHEDSPDGIRMEECPTYINEVDLHDFLFASLLMPYSLCNGKTKQDFRRFQRRRRSMPLYPGFTSAPLLVSNHRTLTGFLPVSSMSILSGTFEHTLC